MRTYLYLFLFLVIPFVTSAQTPSDAIEACREAKVRSFGSLQKGAQGARMQYPGDASIDVNYYKLDLNITYTPQYLRGVATVKIKSLNANLTYFYLDFNNVLRVDSVKSGTAKLTYQVDKGQLLITPTRPLAKDEFVTVVVYYQGKPDNSQGSFSFGTHGPNNDPVIWSLSEPYGARDWFPCKDTPADKADSSDIWITAPRFFTSVSNGTLEGIINNADSSRTYRWRNRYPIAPYLISVAMSNYTRIDQTFRPTPTDSMPVTHYVYPEAATALLRTSVEETTRMLSFFSDYFGPYPFLKEKYGHAQCGFGGGMEHQTISSMGGFTQNLIAHELAHQWFGDKITCQTWEHIWLNEGFASYAEALYQESVRGQAGYQATINSFMNQAYNARGTLYVQNINSVNEIFNSNRTYAKGAVVLHMLRGMVGDIKFKEILKSYSRSSRAYSTATTEDFAGIVFQVYGRSLDYFFKQWIYGESYPTYRVTWSGTPTGDPNQWALQLRLEQTTNTTNPTAFMMPIQVRVATTAGDTTMTVFNASADQTFNFTVKAQPRAIVLDPNNWILKRVASVTDASPPLVTNTNEPVLATAITVLPNPVTGLLRVEVAATQTFKSRLALVDILGREVAALPEQTFPTGRKLVDWDVMHLPTGRYTLLINNGEKRLTQTVLVVK
ncbi:M1 family aminopeptidase [Tellurirhabdus bombi]|uniref:M1 family aminopeptidase n=1 Tax=Tellurirhabdus bombi TaxID=2907205 RepID=UPI001F473E77|nr:M1 family aminopeptidase [Tellurirhabdus bombi]